MANLVTFTLDMTRCDLNEEVDVLFGAYPVKRCPKCNRNGAMVYDGDEPYPLRYAFIHKVFIIDDLMERIEDVCHVDVTTVDGDRKVESNG